MRKRDRISIAKKLNKLAVDYNQFVTGQIYGSAYYFENDSEVKGIDFSFASYQCAKDLLIEFNKIIKQIEKKSR